MIRGNKHFSESKNEWISLSSMNFKHILNVINKIEENARTGLNVVVNGSSHIIRGEDVKRIHGYDEYVKELESRVNSTIVFIAHPENGGLTIPARVYHYGDLERDNIDCIEIPREKMQPIRFARITSPINEKESE